MVFGRLFASFNSSSSSRKKVINSVHSQDEDNVNSSIADDAIHLQERENAAAAEDAGTSLPQGGENTGISIIEEVISSPLGKRKSPPAPIPDQGTGVGTDSTVAPSASAILVPVRLPSSKKMKVYYSYVSYSVLCTYLILLA
jgi:hypothetical protein